MPWRGANGTHCHSCGGHRDEVGQLSARYRCVGCGEGNMLANRRELKQHSGPWFLHWRRAVAAAVGAILLEEQAADNKGAQSDADND